MGPRRRRERKRHNLLKEIMAEERNRYPGQENTNTPKHDGPN